MYSTWREGVRRLQTAVPVIGQLGEQVRQQRDAGVGRGPCQEGKAGSQSAQDQGKSLQTLTFFKHL